MFELPRFRVTVRYKDKNGSNCAIIYHRMKGVLPDSAASRAAYVTEMQNPGCTDIRVLKVEQVEPGKD